MGVQVWCREYIERFRHLFQKIIGPYIAPTQAQIPYFLLSLFGDIKKRVTYSSNFRTTVNHQKVRMRFEWNFL